MTPVKLTPVNTAWQTRPMNGGRVLASLLLFLLALSATGTVFWLWTTGQPIAALWVGLTLWLTVLVAGMSFWLLSLGRQS
ncbi:hypothetical protein LX87_03502 [Larkinella arboricola]|uniref:Uncharacterized protein n=1 Tax=Larkinella arboricola TaxID=643671 RepID=A0A327WTV1_LARAB|nr:TIGR03758 family integrating conjugative element protein [Larkinella arboricola]RAJ95754.1 hypothetical protein LX87_03502 [Larkinella arboricola]